MQEEYIVDRIEGKIVVIESEDSQIINVLLENIKGNPKEGDVLIKEGSYFIIDEEATKKRKEKINNMMKNIWK